MIGTAAYNDTGSLGSLLQDDLRLDVMQVICQSAAGFGIAIKAGAIANNMSQSSAAEIFTVGTDKLRR